MLADTGDTDQGTDLPRNWLQRGAQVARILWRRGLGPYVRSLGFDRFLSTVHRRKEDTGTQELTLPQQVRLACEELGPVAIKLAQTASSRPDVVPGEYIEELGRLQSGVPPFSAETAREIVEAELGCAVEEAFAEFSPEPVASASIAQVHLATLLGGEAVAVKVQRPNLDRLVDWDLRLLGLAAREVEKRIPKAADYRPAEQVAEFGRNLRDELDFEVEGRNTDRLRAAVALDEHVRVPWVYWELSGRRVLTQERIDGISVADAAALDACGADRDALASHFAASMLRQLLVVGFFHADPHPGNVFVQADGKLAMLDCGSALGVARELQTGVAKLVLAVLEADGQAVYEEVTELGVVTERTDLQLLRSEVLRLMGRYAGLDTAQVSLAALVVDLFRAISASRLSVPAVFTAILRAFLLTDGTCRALSPAFNFRDACEQVTRERIREQLKLGNILRELVRGVRDLDRYVHLLPRQVSELLGKAIAGGLTLRVDPVDRGDVVRRVDVMVNRLAYALVVSGMIIGASTILASERAVSILSAPGAVTFGIVGVLMGAHLLYSILRSGRL